MRDDDDDAMLNRLRFFDGEAVVVVDSLSASGSALRLRVLGMAVVAVSGSLDRRDALEDLELRELLALRALSTDAFDALLALLSWLAWLLWLERRRGNGNESVANMVATFSPLAILSRR